MCPEVGWVEGVTACVVVNYLKLAVGGGGAEVRDQGLGRLRRYVSELSSEIGALFHSSRRNRRFVT